MKKDREYNIWKLIQLNIKQLLKNIEIKFKRECYKFYDRFVLNIDLPDTGYEDLAPEKNIKNGDEYLNALFWAINNENIKNIALTGPYGSGKSSIIQSYLTKHPGTKAINISLATFYCNECQEPVKDDEYEKKIELGILKQLFYKVNSARIPQSRYRKITKKYYKRYLQVVIEIVIALLAGITFLVPDIMEKIYNVINKSSEYYEINFGLSMIIVGIFAIIIILSFTYVLKLCMTRFRVKEVDIADKAKVAVDKDENSIFDKYMDELVYFFEATEYNVVFIEDLDRFDSTKIFVKLRELNSILNNYELIKRKIIFVYAIKDDMFINVERTKFFDFIIPVIPIINSTNSGEILREKLLIKKQVDGTFKSNLYNISSSYISLISPFIDDMRILTSTCNEFIVYKNTLINVNLDDEEMFSMMIFKGLYPKEFSDLEAEKGIVKRAFRDKNLFINSKQRKLESDKKSLEEILNAIKEDIFESVKDVKAALLNYLSGNDAPFVSCEIRAIDYYYDQIMQDNFDMDVFKFQGEIYIKKYNRNNRYRKDLSTDIEVRKYLKRIEYLTNNEDEKKKKIYNKIENINKTINELNTFSLKKLIELYGSKEVLSENVKENKLLVFLLRKGYINENYADYINYFYPNSITLEEMNYIRSIRMQEALGYTHHIKNVELVCDKIEDYEFEQKEVLNFDIVDYLITKRSDSEMCDKLFSGLSKDEKEFFEFTKAYFDRKINIDIYIKLLCKHDDKFWEKVCNDKLIAEDKKYEYLTYILNNADLDDIVKININSNCYENYDNEELEEETLNCQIEFYIKKDKYALKKLSSVNTDKMKDVIEQLEIEFYDIDIDGVDKSILEYIFLNNCYEINSVMLHNIFKVFFPDKEQLLNICNYSVICDVDFKPLLLRFKDDIECFKNYVKEQVVGQSSNVNENVSAVENIISRLLNEDLELCEELLLKQKIIWQELNYCCLFTEENSEKCKKLWDFIILNEKVIVDWSIFVEFYKTYGDDSIVVKWVEKNIDTLILQNRPDQLKDNMIKDIIVENIGLDTFEKITKNYVVEDFDVELGSFNKERIDILIENNYIPYSTEILAEMNETMPSCIIHYIIDNKKSFLDSINEIDLPVVIVSELIQNDCFSENEKLQILELVNTTEISQDIAMQIRNMNILVPKKYSEAAWNGLENSERYQLLLNQMDNYSVLEISEKFAKLDDDYKKLSDVTRRHREYLSIDNYGYNDRLLSKLQNKGYISSYKIQEYYEKGEYSGKSVKKQHYEIWIKKQ